MSDVIWSDDDDLFKLDAGCFRALPAQLKHLVEGTDGATDATGKVFTSTAVGSGFVTAGVGLDSEAAACTHFLEVTSGQYEGFYKIVTAAAASLTLDRQIGASLTSLSFRVRTFADLHTDAHDWLQGEVIKREEDEDWEDSELHAIDERKFAKVCACHVLAMAYLSASRRADDIWSNKAKLYRQERDRRFSTLGSLWKDTDDDGEMDEETAERFGGSVEIAIV